MVSSAVFAAVAFSHSHCITVMREYAYRRRGCWKVFMRHTAEMHLGAMMYIPRFMKTGSAIQKFIKGVADTQTA
jgi:hypothetical protein